MLNNSSYTAKFKDKSISRNGAPCVAVLVALLNGTAKLEFNILNKVKRVIYLNPDLDLALYFSHFGYLNLNRLVSTSVEKDRHTALGTLP